MLMVKSLSVNSKKALQIIDANLNRLREGIRVAEEIVRYLPQAKKSYILLQSVRRKVGRLENKIREKLCWQIVEARNTSIDLGANSTATVSRNARLSSRKGAGKHAQSLIDAVEVKHAELAILSANFKRAEEAARSLEEYLKLFSMGTASENFRKIRFELYDIEQKAQQAALSLCQAVLRRRKLINALEKLPIYLVLSRENTNEIHPLELASLFYQNGGRLIQVRLKSYTPRKLVNLILQLKKEFARALIIVNDRVDIALASEAHGVHLGETDIPVRNVRGITQEMIIGCTVRDLTKATSALKNGADYLGVGSIFVSPTKPEAKVIGISTLRRIKKSTNAPIAAIGGINEQNFEKVLEAGADALCVVSAVGTVDKAKSFFRRVKNFWKEKK